MVEPIELEIVKRNQKFVPDVVRLLVFIGHKFDCMQVDAAKLAAEYWNYRLEKACTADRLACNREKVKDNQVRQERQRKIIERFEACKESDIASYEKQFAAS